jgi:hypothetical protein
MSQKKLNRREFLRGSVAAVGGIALVSCGVATTPPQGSQGRAPRGDRRCWCHRCAGR